MKDNRRNFIKATTSLAAAFTVGAVGSGAAKGVSHIMLPQHRVKWPVIEGPDTPKLTLNCPSNASQERMQMHKQFGADYVCMSGPSRLPWKESELRAIMDRFKAAGLTVINMMIGGFEDAIYGREGRDRQIQDVQDSLIAAGAVGLPVVEYNFYAHRLTEGYYNVEGRGGAGYLGFDYHRKMANPADNDWNIPRGRSADEMAMAPSALKPKPGHRAYTQKELWRNITYFLEAVIPVAEKAGVRMALHPNDPPAPISRGSQQIMNSFEGWKKLVSIVDSPSNGMTYDCGVSNETGADPLEVLRYLSDRDRINHVHYRNCIVETPSIKYVEVFPDNGTVDMLEIMQELVRRKYRFGLFPEHPRGNNIDQKLGGDLVGYLYNLAYARAMFQASLTLQQMG